MIRGQADILEVMTRDGLLDDFFSHSIGMAPYLQEVARMVKELTHRFPHMNIVEIGKISY
jgi:hybrid polyketide synthase / nonribosomal peptide synthetase ACE1